MELLKVLEKELVENPRRKCVLDSKLTSRQGKSNKLTSSKQADLLQGNRQAEACNSNVIHKHVPSTSVTPSASDIEVDTQKNNCKN